MRAERNLRHMLVHLTPPFHPAHVVPEVDHGQNDPNADLHQSKDAHALAASCATPQSALLNPAVAS
jgi:hypothetical protein